MLCSSIPDDHAASVIILYTPFCEVMVCISRNSHQINAKQWNIANSFVACFVGGVSNWVISKSSQSNGTCRYCKYRRQMGVSLSIYFYCTQWIFNYQIDLLKYWFRLDRNEGGTHKFPGKRHLLSFLSWLDYIDQLIRESHEVNEKTFHENFTIVGYLY